MKYERCINCNNNEDFELACKLKNSNYGKDDVSSCFVKSSLHTNMDNIIDQISKLLDKLKNKKV